MSDILDKICAYKKEEIASRQKMLGLAEIRKAAENSPELSRGFAAGLREKKAKAEIGLIAEIKKASPSRGLIRADFDPSMLAKEYYQGGASCISVLTDMNFFQGDDGYLRQVKMACPLPVLRKDFMLDPYQIFESRLLGADCILLILAALEDTLAKELEDIALGLGMDVLIETHNQQEMDRALQMKSPLIGVNNRDLKTFSIDLSLSEKLLPQVPSDRIPVAESGFYKYEDFLRLRPFGVSTFLVGESLMREKNVKDATRSLLGYAA